MPGTLDMVNSGGAWQLPPPPAALSGGLYNEPAEGNSLTKSVRALIAYLQGQGQQSFGYGNELIGQGAQGVGAASGTTGAALRDLDTSGETLSPALQYWQGILSGGKAATDAIAPVASQVGKNLATATRTVDRDMPRGGYAASLRASLPVTAAGQVNDALLQLQPFAAQQVQGISQQQANTGGLRNQIAGNQGNLAGLLGQLGLGTAGLGAGLLGQASNNQLTVRGQDVQGDANSPTSTLTKGLAGIPGAAAGGILGTLTGKIPGLSGVKFG